MELEEIFGSLLKLMFGEQFKDDASIIKYLPWLNWQRAIVQSWNANVFRIRLRVDPFLTAIRLVNLWKTEHTFFWRYCMCVYSNLYWLCSSFGLLLSHNFYFRCDTCVQHFFFSCRLLLSLCRFVCDLNVLCCCFYLLFRLLLTKLL